MGLKGFKMAYREEYSRPEQSPVDPESRPSSQPVPGSSEIARAERSGEGSPSGLLQPSPEFQPATAPSGLREPAAEQSRVGSTPVVQSTAPEQSEKPKSTKLVLFGIAAAALSFGAYEGYGWL